MENGPNESQPGGSNRRWAQFRFSVIGSLLASPPGKGELQARIKELAAKTWRHPITGEPTTFGFSTIERCAADLRRDRSMCCNEKSEPITAGALR